jgi:hypothetical protein
LVISIDDVYAMKMAYSFAKAVLRETAIAVTEAGRNGDTFTGGCRRCKAGILKKE